MALGDSPSAEEVAAVQMDMSDLRGAMKDKYGDESMEATLAKVADAKYR